MFNPPRTTRTSRGSAMEKGVDASKFTPFANHCSVCSMPIMAGVSHGHAADSAAPVGPRGASGISLK